MTKFETCMFYIPSAKKCDLHFIMTKFETPCGKDKSDEINKFTFHYD